MWNQFAVIIMLTDTNHFLLLKYSPFASKKVVILKPTASLIISFCIIGNMGFNRVLINLGVFWLLSSRI